MAEQQAPPKGAIMTQWLSQDKVKAAIKRVLPKHLSPERLIQIAIITISKTPILQECTPLSIVGAVIEASELGLSLEPSLGQAYLVPYSNKKTEQKEAQMIPGYRGLMHLARNSGLVRSFSAEVVRKTDDFRIELGTSRGIQHVPNYTADGRMEEKNWIGAYATVYYANPAAECDFIYLERERVFQARAKSQAYAYDSGPWKTDPEEMWRKTAIRRLAKYMPQATELSSFHRASHVDELREELGDETPLIDLGELKALEPAPDRPKLEEPKRKATKKEETEPASGPATPAAAGGNGESGKSAPGAAVPATKEAKKPDGELSADEVSEVYNYAMSQSWTLKDVKEYVAKYFKKESVKLLTREEVTQLKNEIKAGGRTW